MAKASSTQTHFRTCSLCEAMCGLEITLEGNKIKSIKGDKNDPFSKGFICPKATALQDLHEDPDRLRKPLKKTPTGWKEVSWKEGLNYAAEKIKQVQSRYGTNAMGIYFGNPNVHNLGAMLFGPPLARALKTKYRYSATSVDQLPHHFASQFMFGHMLLIPIPDINRTNFFLCIGANPYVSNGSLMSAGGMPQRVKELQERGGKVVTIDPRRTETAEKADQHIFIRPGTDVYFLASFIHLLCQKDLASLPDYLEGVEKVRDHFEEFTPEVTSNITGISPEILKEIVEAFTASDKAVCYGRIGVSTQEHGSLCQWMINLINILTGNFDTAGGTMFTSPAFDVIKMGRKGTMHKINRWTSKVRKHPEFNGELPVATLAEDILTEDQEAIRGMITVAGNPVLSTPNGTQLEKAFEKLECLISIDIYLNETSKHADIILPTTTGLENDHYDIVFNSLAIRDTAKYSPALFSPSAGVLPDWKVLKQLTRKLRKPKFSERLLDPFMTPRFMLKEALKKSGNRTTLKELINHPHGLDLGPLKPVMPKRLFTPNKKVDLLPSLFTEKLKQLPVENKKAKDEFLLIGRRELRSNNSWMHNIDRLVKGPERCLFFIHPEDANNHNIDEEDKVEVSSRVGSVKVKTHITDEVMRGVVSLPHGYGHQRNGTKWATAERHAGVSINDLTDDQFVDSLSGNAAFSAVPVTIKKVEA